MNGRRSSPGIGLAAVVAGVIGLLTLPVITVAYARTDDGAGTDPAWGDDVRELLRPMVSFAEPDTVYSAYGKVYFLVLLGLLVGLLALSRARGGGMSGAERWGFRLSIAGIILNLVGIVTDYTVFEDSVVENVGFAAGSLLGLLFLVVGSVMLGIVWLRSAGAPRLGAWLLLLALPGMVLLGLLGFGNLPSMPLAWFCIAWLALGRFLMADGSPLDDDGGSWGDSTTPVART